MYKEETARERATALSKFRIRNTKSTCIEAWQWKPACPTKKNTTLPLRVDTHKAHWPLLHIQKVTQT